MEDGIYFGLDEAVYHALPRLSVSGMQKLLTSPATFWASSWLNPKRAATHAAALATSTSPYAADVLAMLRELHPDMPEPGPEAAEAATKAQVLGKAYHRARLEPHEFDARFVRALDKADMPKGSLFTGSDMGKELEARELKKTGNVVEQAERLEAAGFDRAKLWHIQLADWEAARGDRTPIAAEYWDDIRADMALIQATPEIAAILSGGFAEVTILWTDSKGIKMKVRLDYLREDGWSDFKTFANPSGKHVEQCIADAFQFNRYHIQAAGYREPVERVRSGWLAAIGDATQEQRELIVDLTMDVGPPVCHYVFQEKGGVPNLLAKRLRFYEVPESVQAQDAIAASEAHRERVHELTEQPSLWYGRANREIRKAKRLYRAYSSVYEPGEPWRPFNPVGELTDMDFRTHWLDEEVGE